MNVYAIDLNLLSVFEAIWSERSVTRAAAKIGRSQPAVSNALGRLRRQLRDPLFVRAGKTMVPTPRAVELAPEIDSAFGHVRRAFEASAFRPEESRHSFRLASSDEIEQALFPALAERLSASAPGVTISGRRLAGLFETPEIELRSGAVDFAIGRLPAPPSVESGLYSRRLYDDSVVCIARAGNPAVGRRLGLRRFLSARHVAAFYPGEGPGLVDRAISERGHKREVVLSVPHLLSIPFVVASTDLIATLPGSVVEAYESILPIRRFPCPIAIPPLAVNLVWHARTHENAPHVWLRKEIVEAARAARTRRRDRLPSGLGGAMRERRK